MVIKDFGESIGRGYIPPERQTWVIHTIGESFKSPFHALRQYIDNSNDAMKLRRQYDPNFDNNLIIINLDISDNSIRIIDFGPGITPEKPVFETPSGEYIYDKNKVKRPYINSFPNMKDNIGNSVKEFLENQSGQNATGMLAFINLNCKYVQFISQIDGRVYTYTIKEDNDFGTFKGGEKSIPQDGTEVLLKKIDKRVFNNHFNPKRLELELRRTYSEQIAQGEIAINLNYITSKKRGEGKPGPIPFIKIKPMDITGKNFSPNQIKTRSGHHIILNLKLKDRPSEEAFVRVNCRGAGGIDIKEILYESIWENKYTWGYIHADFLNFAGNDKSQFNRDELLEEFIEVMEEKIGPILANEINKLKSRSAEEMISKMLKNLEFALSRTLKNQNIDLTGTTGNTKQCPKCEKVVPINQQECPRCGYEWPKTTKTCKECGKEISSNAKICPECGKDLIEKRKCPNCGNEIPKLSYNCPICGYKLRERSERLGKSPHITPVPQGAYNPRSAIDIDDKTKSVTNILINEDHVDYLSAEKNGFLQLYISVLAGKEVAKYQFGKEKKDYSEDMIGVLIGMFQELTLIKSIRYKEGIR